MTQLCALAGVTRQVFYKRDEEALPARLAIEQFVVQYVLEVRVKDPKIGMDKLWRMYSAKFPEEYRVGRDVFRSILHERGLNLRHRPASHPHDGLSPQPADLPQSREECASHAPQPYMGQRHHLHND